MDTEGFGRVVHSTSDAVTNRSPPASTIDALLAGERQAIARAISHVERGNAQAVAIGAALAPHLGRAHVVGLTGPPGAGKSTLVNALLGELLGQGLRVGVVAVDPSSPISGGALLGDRVRMGEHGEHVNVFVRSVAARGHLGGLSRTTRGIVDLLDAAGFDVILVETVGAGQSEVEIAGLADTCIVACPPGLGDEVQAIKAGILEIADLLVVTKGDLPAARATMRDLRHMTHLRPNEPEGAWCAPVLSVTATSGEGIAALVEQIAAHATALGRGRRLRATAPAAVGAVANALPANAPAVTTPSMQSTIASAPSASVAPVNAAPANAASASVRFDGAAAPPVDSSCGDAVCAATLRVAAEHLDDAGACARSVLFALADGALGRALRAPGATAGVVVDAHITFLRAARGGDVLATRVRELSRTQGEAVYRVDVSGADAALPVATLVGTVRIGPPASA